MPEPNPEPTRTIAPSSNQSVTANGPETVGDPTMASLVTPHCIGDYVLLGELGRGGMGVVYRAEDPRLKREVALKVMLPQFAANLQAKVRFVREARAQAKVEHDHVAAIHQVSEHDGLPYLVMPLLKGMTLQAALKANPRPPLAEVIRIGREVAEGLAAAHEKGLVHRDIKPANIWLEGKKLRVKVLDFGLARSASNVDAEDTEGPVTREGAIVGTPAFMSPEQARGESVDARTDLFSLGVVLYQMLTGQMPFTGATAFVVLAEVTGHTPPSVGQLVHGLPPALSDLIDRLLAKQPVGRPDSAAAIVDELRQIELHLVAGVQLIPLDSIPSQQLSGPDPFAALDATEVNSAERQALPLPSPQSPPWLWSVVGLVVLAGVLAVAWASEMFAPKKLPPEPVEPEPAKSPAHTPKPRDVPPPTVGNVLPFFNGKDLTGWFGAKDHWRVENGEIVGAFPAGVEPAETHLISTREYADFELSFQVRNLDWEGARGKGAWSGVTLRGRVSDLAKFHASGTKCLFGGANWGLLTQGYAASMSRPLPAALATVKQKDFNDVSIRVTGSQVRVTINGVLAIDELREKIQPSGVIAWQFGTGIQELRIRNLRFSEMSRPK